MYMISTQREGDVARQWETAWTSGMYPPPQMTCMYPPPQMTCMYPPPHMTCLDLRERAAKAAGRRSCRLPASAL